jgi:hypothetical protein
MATTECLKCGSVSVLIYFKILPREEALIPSDWPSIIDCPKCGTVEQRGDIDRGWDIQTTLRSAA